MESKRTNPPSGPSSSGGRFLQGVWMSKCEGGRIERLTKWSEGQKEQRLGSLDKQEHSRMVKMNLMKLEVRDELTALRKSRRTPTLVPTSPTHETAPPNIHRQQGRIRETSKSSSRNRGRSQEVDGPNPGKKHLHVAKQLDGYLSPKVEMGSRSPGQSMKGETGDCVVKSGGILPGTQLPKPSLAAKPDGHEGESHNGYENDVRCSGNDINGIQRDPLSPLSSKDSGPNAEPTSKFVRKMGRVELDKETVKRLMAKSGQDGLL
ncbi:uncharacterized protein LOC124269452 [Haliotis rubra]|uniref:uncharacterized protein LOC124269452 n=1 Tax=Haliotis rubra TaxID=36100 RepID=UPI001EE5B4AD|nr:uncharacterized protein LOC124269452 [Haliotis rubra]